MKFWKSLGAMLGLCLLLATQVAAGVVRTGAMPPGTLRSLQAYLRSSGGQRLIAESDPGLQAIAALASPTADELHALGSLYAELGSGRGLEKAFARGEEDGLAFIAKAYHHAPTRAGEDFSGWLSEVLTRPGQRAKIQKIAQAYHLLGPVALEKIQSLAARAAAAATAEQARGLALELLASSLDAENPLAQASDLPYHLLPFDKIEDGHYAPALAAGLLEQRRQITAIADNPETPTFENTILAFEQSGDLLERASAAFGNKTNSDTNPALDQLKLKFAPLLAAHSDSIYLDSKLFARIDDLYQRRESLGLDDESLRLLETTHRDFLRAGARLSAADKTRLGRFNGQLAVATTRFKQNVLKGRQEAAVAIDDVAELNGLSEAEIAAAAKAAEARGLTGKWLIHLQNTTVQPVLARLKNRALRRRIAQASAARGIGGPADNTALIAKIAGLRAERAGLLGHPNAAAYEIAGLNAGTLEAVDSLLRPVAAAALKAVKREAAALQGLIDAKAREAGAEPFKLEAYDWPFYAEQVRKAQYDFDETQVKPYLELENVLHKGLFYAANQLYGITVQERQDLPKPHPDARVFEIFDQDGSPLALFIADYFSRDGKQGGAWMQSLVQQSRLFSHKPVIINQLNLTKPAEGQPVLLSFDEVTTLFHEFGHGLHGIFSNVLYPSLSGTNVPRDNVEFPSMFNEMWAIEPAVLANYARHHQTGEPLPTELLEKFLAARRFNQGYETLEFLAAALLDQAWHRIVPGQAITADMVMEFEKSALKAAGVDHPAVPPRYHSSYFAHIFAGGYYAAYQAYLWSEVLARAAGAWFHQHGGLTRANGDRLRDKILSRGDSRPTKESFLDFNEGPAAIEPLLQYRGLIPNDEGARP